MKKLILGDNLAVLRGLPDESVDLIYLDPPFFSNRHYEVIWGDDGEKRSFEDRWSGGMMHYIAWLKERVREMHRVLKPTGSLYLHCDHHANAYIRVHILDPIFGEKNFRNEIVWHYGQRNMHVSTQFNRKHDTILYYTKSDLAPFRVITTPYTEDEIKAWWNVHYEEDGTAYYLENAGKGKPRYKRYIKDIVSSGKALDDVWNIGAIQSSAKERIGYPTQKPEALLERIILASSNEGDVVLDPFVGGGTTVAVAERLGRQWIGIDQSVAAIKVCEHRLANMADLLSGGLFETEIAVNDYDKIFNTDPFVFQDYIIRVFGGIPNPKRVGDKGIDGSLVSVPIQVKQSENIGRNVIDNLKSAAERFDKELYARNAANGDFVAHLIAFSFGRGAIEEVARLAVDEGIRINLVRVDSLIPVSHAPVIHSLTATHGDDGVTLTASVSCDAGIALFSWDLDYDPKAAIFKPEIFIDHSGTITNKFEPGEHCVAVRVSSNDGLDAISTVSFAVP